MLQMDIDGVFRQIGELGQQQQRWAGWGRAGGGLGCWSTLITLMKPGPRYILYILLLNTYAAFHMIQVSPGLLYSSSISAFCPLELKPSFDEYFIWFGGHSLTHVPLYITSI